MVMQSTLVSIPHDYRSRCNEEYKKKGCPIRLTLCTVSRRFLDPIYPCLDRINDISSPLLIFHKDTLFALYRLFMEKMGLYPELITKIWLTFVAKMTFKFLQEHPCWNPEKLKMILDGLLLKIN